jgi:toxin ParE1/3/4
VIDVRLLPGAEDDLAEAADFYDSRRDGLGDEFLAQVEKTVGLLCQFPKIGPVWRAPIRRFVLSRFPYSLYYQIEGESLQIVAISHQKRGEGQWLSRFDAS